MASAGDPAHDDWRPGTHAQDRGLAAEDERLDDQRGRTPDFFRRLHPPSHHRHDIRLHALSAKG